MQPETRYVRSGDVDVAYQIAGEGPLDMVFIPGTISHLDLLWSHPGWVRFVTRLTAFARVVFFDKRGTGLSDPVSGPVDADQRMDDVRAVMGAAGMDSAAVFGFSEGAPLGALFAATHPERTVALVLTGGFARLDPDDPAIRLAREAFEHWGEGRLIQLMAPSLSSNSATKRVLAAFERASASPQMARALFESNMRIDVRPILSAVRVPTLVVHRRDELVSVRYARELADGIPGARLVELDGDDHVPWFGDVDTLVDQVEEFLTGTRPQVQSDRTLATVLITDIVGSTERNAAIGDAAWREQLDRHSAIMREALGEHRGREVKTTGDGFLATFDGPARALRCAEATVDRVRALGIDLKVGIHTGEVENYPDGDVGGMAVNIGARIGAVAGPGEILVSSTVKDLVIGSGFRFAPRGTRELKGVPGEWSLFALEGAERVGADFRAAEESMTRLDRAAVRFATRAPRTSRAIARVLAREKKSREERTEG